MSVKRTNLRSLKNIGVFLVFLVLLGAAVAGVTFTKPFPVQTVGAFQLAAFPSGLALYQHGENQHFYSLSPLNDYVVSADGNRAALLSLDLYNRQKSAQLDDWPLWERLSLGVQSYWGDIPLKYNVKAEHSASYLVKPVNDGWDITTTLESVAGVRELGSTVAINPDDFIFEADGSLYSQNTLVEVADVSQLYEFSFHIVDQQTLIDQEGRMEIKSGKILIHNPSLPGFLIIQAEPSEVLWFDLYHQLVEVVKPVSEESASVTMKVRIFNSLDKALAL